MIIRTNAKDNRKGLIKTLSEILEEKPRYCGAPTFAYEFSLCRVDRDAALHLAPTLADQSVMSAVTLLNQHGFDAEIVDDGSEIVEAPDQSAEENGPEQYLAVFIEHEKISKETLAKLERIVSSKATLLRKALGEGTLSIVNTPKGYAFPWFQIESDKESQRAYAMLVEKLVEFARERTRITASDKETDNPKYAFRCFLLRLGFIGSEFRRERAILLRNLEGNCAFKSGSNPRKNPA